jgi:hypothetical protein
LDIEKTFDLLMNKFHYRGLNDPKVYMDENARRIMSYYRGTFFKMAEIMKITNDKDRLRQLMEKYREVIPELGIVNVHHTPYIVVSNPLVDYYFFVGLNDYGVSLAQRLIDEYGKELGYYSGLDDKMSVELELTRVYQGLGSLMEILKKYEQSELYKQTEVLFKDVQQRMQSLLRG